MSEANDARCPVCGGAALKRYFGLDGWTFAGCRACGHHFGHGGREEAEALGDLYHHDYSGFRDDPVFQRSVRERIAQDFVPRVPAGGAVLDVGCGNGEFLAAAAEAGYRPFGIDLSPAAAELCRARGLDAVSGDFLSADLPGPFQAVTMWDVLEHLPDPTAFARRARELLAPGGVLVMKVPTVGAWAFRVVGLAPRRLAGSVLQAPAHIQFFTRESMDLLARNAGFAGVEQRAIPGMRGSPPARRSLLRSAKRAVLRGIQRVGGRQQMYVWMTAPGARGDASPAERRERAGVVGG
ncbi:class I SAM-dependent methyltransferase [Longimicrobium sp.]|uniref:class I SAM-dependent methyltransferase n=1 Tax=Longimicrobium sp. TaxID=2029185 RepID=UPI002C6CD4A7|nr:class I SAM-dependent methyltransferase [Longimicrobium sp.]HSU17090.1 class I SAM-dependent methyltransferase [Longimicrobium sp.]